MFGYKHYVPVLKGKRAEFPALQNLHSRDHVTPLLEAVPTAPADFIPQRMTVAWANDTPYFVDFLFWDDEELPESAAATHPIRQCFDDVAARGQTAIPVTGTGRSAAYQGAVRHIISSQHHGCAIRLIPEDFDNEAEVPQVLDGLIGYLGVSRNNVDILIDLGTSASMTVAVVSQMFRIFLLALPNIADWRTLTVISGAFPMGLAPLAQGWNLVSRMDWLGWLSLLAHPLQRKPSYGDYTIANPDLPPTGQATTLAQIRYTGTTSFSIFKGGNVHRHPRRYAQFIDICQALIAMPIFRGQAFSFGDAQVHEKATTAGASSGNAETWRTIGTSHHVETVKSQLASSAVP